MKFPQCEIIFSEKLPEKEILFIGGGKFPGEKYFLQLAENREIFCIDKGIELCHKLNILPKILIGDFDSANKISVDWAKKNKIPIKRHPVEKDFTDTQLAINFAERSEENFSAVMTGVFGGRFDHLFSNIFTCANSTKKLFQVHNVIPPSRRVFDREEIFPAANQKVMPKFQKCVEALI